MLDTLAWHSLLDPLAGQSWQDTLARHSFWTLLLDTLAWHSFLTLLLDTPPGHSYRTLLLDSCWTLLLDTLSWHETSFQNEHFPRDFHQKSENPSLALCIANPTGTARFNTSKTPLWNCKSQWNYDANVSLSRNPAPVQWNHCFQPSSLRCAAPATKNDFRHFPQDIQNCNFTQRLGWVWPPPLSHTFFKIDVLPETCRKYGASQTTLQLQIPLEQRDSTPLKHHSETANPNGTTTQTRHFHETLRLCSEMHHVFLPSITVWCTLQWNRRKVTLFQVIKSHPIGDTADGCERLRTVANGCGRLRTVAVAQANFGEHTSNPQTPNL